MKTRSPMCSLAAVSLAAFLSGCVASAAPTLKPGSFRYEVAGAGEDGVIDAGTLQYQSTTDEHVIGLVQAGAARYAVSLFLPLEPKPGAITFKAFDEKAFKKAPTASVFIGSWFYHARGGTLTLEQVAGGAISGSFEFTAQHQNDAKKTVTVKGAFRQLPLVEKKGK